MTSPTKKVDAAVQIIDAAIDAAQAPAPALVREAFDIRAPRLIEPVEIMLDRPRHLRLPFWALKLFEDKTGLSAWDQDKVFGWPPKLDVIVTLLWCALLDEDPDLTIERVERMPGLEFGQIYYILHCLDECWGRNAPAPEPAGDGSTVAAPNRRAALPTG
jgi:hypothetical protein